VKGAATAGAWRAADLHEHVRARHRPRVALVNVGLIVLAASLLLTITGVLAIHTTSPEHATRQVGHACMALVCASLIAIPHYRWLQRLAIPLVILMIGLLIFVLLPFIPDAIVHPRNGARRWISLPGYDFQPSEIAKIIHAVSLAAWLRSRRSQRLLTGLLVPFALTIAPFVLVLVEPDLGSSLLFIPSLFAMLLVAGTKIRHLVLICALGLGSAPLIYPFLMPHQKARVQALYFQAIGDARHTQDIGFQGDRAQRLVGAGGFAGVGVEEAEQLVVYNRLPEEHNDMIFAVIVCRWGLLGAIGVGAMFAMLCGGGLLTAAFCRDPFGRVLAVGLTTMLFAQAYINLGMNIGVLPITGMTLPFISYGGSSLLSVWITSGLLYGIALRRPQYMTRESFDFTNDPD